ncbi:MAG: hypothetical protein AAY43_12370 [Methanosarcina sp. 795]|uniref:Transmembrane protein n=1 Tax=Methanosarcina flavescens TaxID=1715806 RepID=A0A660HPH7_9EURY|nr:MAG: hypothetical protein AAY43_12370 [Methanosarcina sp. 795]AYK13956.1 hypothetical protein AOB57_000890 [Methanosarcina flavescens]
MGKHLNRVCFQDKASERLKNNPLQFILTDIIFANNIKFKTYIRINEIVIELSLTIVAIYQLAVNLKHIIKVKYINILNIFLIIDLELIEKNNLLNSKNILFCLIACLFKLILVAII